MLKLFGLDKCGTCDKARGWLGRAGIEHAFIDYRERRVDPATLKDWSQQVGGWEKLVNRTSTTWRNLPDARKSPATDPEWLLLLKEYPALIRRPVLLLEDGTIRQGFTDKQYKLLFGKG